MNDQNNQPPASTHDQVADRRAKLARLRDEFHVDPYGQRVDDLTSIADARAQYNAEADEAHKADSAAADNRPVVKVAGRVMLHRVMGNLIFATIRDGSGDIQLAISKKAVGADTFKIAKLADLGDIVTAQGPLGATKTGEISVWAAGDEGYTIASKSLAPPPGKYHGLQDAELRYRHRYVDLYTNPQVMKLMRLRMRIIDEMRQYLRSKGYLEVETPMLQPIHGGAAARPFITHHNALDMRLYLRIAPELYLKRLLVGGFDKVFEINRNFRNEGISPRHNPEFTMLEAYEAFGNWQSMADMVEDMTCTIAQNVLGSLTIEHKNAEGETTKTINLARPWKRVRMDDLVEQHTGWKFDKQPIQSPQHDAALPKVIDLYCTRLNNEHANATGLDADILKLKKSAFYQHLIEMTPAEQLVEVYEKVVEHTLIAPCFVTHVPSVAIPLARESKEDPFFADVYELAINGQEISPGYTELNDPDVQEQHLRHQVGDREEQQHVDEDFLNALRVGMPPAGGMGLGVDRLVMMLTGAESIRDIILFPLMRAKDGE